MTAFLALLRKEFVLYFKNAFISVVIGLSVLLFGAVYYLMPRQVDVDLEIGVLAYPVPAALETLVEDDEGLVLREYTSLEALAAAVESEEIMAGYAFEAGWNELLAAGDRPRIEFLYASDLDPDFVELFQTLLEELFYAMTGDVLDTIEWDERVLGVDMADHLIPARERMRPLVVLFLLVTEIFGVSALIAEEKEHRTDDAILITHMSVAGFFSVKAVFGFVITFVQAMLIFALVGGFTGNFVLVAAYIALGAGMIVAISFLVASVATDFMSVAGWAIPALILLIIPGFGALFPGTAAAWVRVIPSYPMVNGLHQATQFGQTWSEAGPALIALLAFDLGVLVLGLVALRRRYR